MKKIIKIFIGVIFACGLVATLPAKSKTVYLTIDDGPSKHTKEVVDYLRKSKIPAVFYCLGSEIEKYPEEAMYIVKNGYLMGNHGYSHRAFSDIETNEAKAEILRTDKMIDDIYKRAGKKRKIKTFRFPFLDPGFHRNYKEFESHEHKGTDYKKYYGLQTFLTKLGYTRINWKSSYKDKDRLDLGITIDSLDYKLPSLGRKEIIEQARKDAEAIKKQEIAVVLLHDIAQKDLIKDILKEYILRGVSFSELEVI